MVAFQMYSSAKNFARTNGAVKDSRPYSKAGMVASAPNRVVGTPNVLFGIEQYVPTNGQTTPQTYDLSNSIHIV